MDPSAHFSSSPHPGQAHEVMAAWDRFLRGAEVPPNVVRDVIERSWSRCHSAGVDPERSRAQEPAPPDDLTSLQYRYSDLVDASLPAMAQSHRVLSESGTIMILTDPTGVILETAGDPITLEAAQEVRLVRGANWNELACGTNAIGTALSTGEPVQVHAAEHFCFGIKPWSCSATVVRDPHGEVLGVLDVSGLSGTFHGHFLALALMAAGRIEEHLAAHEMKLRYDLLEAGLRRLSKISPGGVLVFDRKGRLIDLESVPARFLAAIGIDPTADANYTVEAFRSDSVRQAGGATLPEWLRPEWIEPIVRGRERLGTVVVLPDPSPRKSVRPSVDPAVATSGVGAPIIGSSAALQQAVQKARQLANLDVSVLIQGETGVGKERFARTIHEAGARKNGPFVALNCGGLPRDILVSELFGYVEGAFTGAKRSGMIGKIEAADGGTLFLDEIGEMPLEVQPVFLRILEGGELYRLGDSKPRTVAFRLVAATNKDLRAEVAAGRFRQDLFYRVSVTALRVPPLRERREDIPALVEYFSSEVSRRHGVPMKRFEPEVLNAFESYAWPGNVREIRNVVEGMVMLTTGESVSVADLPPDIESSLTAANPQPVSSRAPVTNLEVVERDAISAAIVTCHGNLTLAARELNVSKSTLYLKLEKYGLSEVLHGSRAARPTT